MQEKAESAEIDYQNTQKFQIEVEQSEEGQASIGKRAEAKQEVKGDEEQKYHV